MNLIMWATISKNPAFSEEKEWRIMYTPSIGDTGISGYLKIMKFVPKKNIMTSYFDLIFPQSDPINEIVLGPKNMTDDKTIKNLLRQNGYNIANIKISRSALSYRQQFII